MTIGNRISKLRKEKGISQEALGEHLGVSRQAVSRWELDQSVPDITTLNEIAAFFEVSVIYLLDDTISLSTNNNPPKNKKLEYGVIVAVAISLVISIITIISLNRKISLLNQRIESLGSISYRPPIYEYPTYEYPTQEVLQINSVQLTNHDYKKNTVDVSVELLPHVEPKDLKVILFINEKSYILEKKASQTYKEVINVPLVENIDIKVVLESTEETKTIPLVTSEENITGSLFLAFINYKNYYVVTPGKRDDNIDLELEFFIPKTVEGYSNTIQRKCDEQDYIEGGNAYPCKGIIVDNRLWIEKAELKWLGEDGEEYILDSNVVNKLTIDDHYRSFYEYKGALPKEPTVGKQYELVLEVTDSFERHYQIVLSRKKAKEDSFEYLELGMKYSNNNDSYEYRTYELRFID